MSTVIENQSGNITNINSAGNISFHGSTVINVTANIPLSDLLSINAGSIRMNTVDEMPVLVEDSESQQSIDALMRSDGISPCKKDTCSEGMVFHGLVFKMTIPEPPMDSDGEQRISFDWSTFHDDIRQIQGKYNIHICIFKGKTITGAINEADMPWDRDRECPKSIRLMFINYIENIFNSYAERCRAIKFRIYCSFCIGEYCIHKDKLNGESDNVETKSAEDIIYGKAIDIVVDIHEGMNRLFTPLDTDYDFDYEYETQEFRDSRKRHYYTTYSNKDYLDEGIIIGTTDIDFIGSYGNWYRPIVCSQYKDSKAVILYEKKEMPGQRHGILYRIRKIITSTKKKMLCCLIVVLAKLSLR